MGTVVVKTEGVNAVSENPVNELSGQATAFDVIVVGGGMVGAATAVGFALQGLSVAVIEDKAPKPYAADEAIDLRISAIGCSSVRLLERLGAWKHAQQMRHTPYRRLETWEQPGSEVLFDAQSLGLPELGFMLENRVLQLALWQQMQQHDNLTLFCPDKLRQLKHNADQSWSLELVSGQQLFARLVVAADGANSLVRQQAGIGIDGWQYRQNCMLINVETQSQDLDVTWQQFFRQVRAPFCRYGAITPRWSGMTARSAFVICNL